MKTCNTLTILGLAAAILLQACAPVTPMPTAASMPTNAVPTSLAPQNVDAAFQWLEENAVMGRNLDWTAIRNEADSLSPNPQTFEDTYPAICLAMRKLKDGNAWMNVPSLSISSYDDGIWVMYPKNQIVFWLEPNGPAQKAGIRVGDVIQKVNGKAPDPYDPDDLWSPCNIKPLDTNPQEHLDVLRDGQQLQFTLDKTTMTNYDFANHSSGHRLGTEPLSPGYLDLPEESGYHPGFAAETQKLISQIDSPPVCGWIIDLRGTYGGDFWIYLEALGPILGEGKLGGFVYANGKREPWAYTNGVVVWNGQGIERSIVGPNYRPAKATPVALLTGPATQAASELLVVAFKGRSDVRTFGEPTRGLPTLVTSTTLPDGVMLIASGAFSYDRNEKQYDGPINPDVPVESNWSHRGTDQDPATQAAAAWLASQPACKP